MKTSLWILAVWWLATATFGQTNQTVLLALISESEQAVAMADLLTAQLSGKPGLQLLERNEIEKVRREQSLSSANKDYLKLGRLLGADGVMLLDLTGVQGVTNLTMRIVAVNAGAILAGRSVAWPLRETAPWVESTAVTLDPLLPKLSVLGKDAIPLSVVNFRYAATSADGREVERQLKLLAIQRLSHERQFFVLERQQMRRLSEEKDLKADDSEFWNGRYLLEGVVDQNGIAQDVITIDGGLTPPNGSAPMLFKVSGSRTNYAEVINGLAAKAVELLKVPSTAKDWNAADESAQFFAEAQWALKWDLPVEAEAAVESAWALGKRDGACASLRVRAYLLEIQQPLDLLELALFHFRDPSSTEVTFSPQALMRPEISRLMGPEAPLVDFSSRPSGAGNIAANAGSNLTLDPQNIDRAIHALELYYDFCHTSPGGEPKALPKDRWYVRPGDPDWHQVGVEDLVTASRVLRRFYFQSARSQPVEGQLAALRAMARSVAELIVSTPSVHDSYFVGDRPVMHDEYDITISQTPNVFQCEADWGSFWQERPEDALALYRDLMSSPVFCALRSRFWDRPTDRPELVGWNDSDRRRSPALWNRFLQELVGSTNLLWQIEGWAIQIPKARSEPATAAAFTNLFNLIVRNRDRLLGNNVQVISSREDFDFDKLIELNPWRYMFSDSFRDSLHQRFDSDYGPKLDALGEEFSAHINDQRFSSAIERQIRDLSQTNPVTASASAIPPSARSSFPAQPREMASAIRTNQSSNAGQRGIMSANSKEAASRGNPGVPPRVPVPQTEAQPPPPPLTNRKLPLILSPCAISSPFRSKISPGATSATSASRRITGRRGSCCWTLSITRCSTVSGIPWMGSSMAAPAGRWRRWPCSIQ